MLTQVLILAGICFTGLCLSAKCDAQKLAVLTPDGSAASWKYADELEGLLSAKTVVLDDSLSDAAFRAVAPKAPFNMTTAEARIVGAVIGCDFFVLVKAETLRRNSFERPEYYESHGAIYVVSSRTGRLVYWSLPIFESATPSAANNLLSKSVTKVVADVTTKIRQIQPGEAAESKPTGMEGLPPENSPEAKNFRSPIPFRRIKPEYTSTAFMYDIAATVEIELDLDAGGKILGTEIVRWAGYGLDESVEATVRAMHWRAAERNGKPLAMRVLLRYNFKKIDK